MNDASASVSQTTPVEQSSDLVSLLNLLTNASDAMPKGGRLTVRAKSSSLAGADAAQIDFADTGEGIPAEHLEKIWDPFFTTKPEGRGTGLGLAICRRIVEEHGGAISIASNPGEGTSVQIKLPVTATGRIQFQPEDQLTTGNEESVASRASAAERGD